MSNNRSDLVMVCRSDCEIYNINKISDNCKGKNMKTNASPVNSITSSTAKTKKIECCTKDCHVGSPKSAIRE